MTHRKRENKRNFKAPWLLAAMVALTMALTGCLAEEGEDTGGGGGIPLVWADISGSFSGCTGCHPGLNSFDLKNCANAVAATSGLASHIDEPMVDPGNSAASVLYLVVNGTITGLSQDMTLLANAADIAQWIDDGALCSN